MEKGCFDRNERCNFVLPLNEPIKKSKLLTQNNYDLLDEMQQYQTGNKLSHARLSFAQSGIFV